MDFSSLLFSFTGRLNRAPYWLASIGSIVAASVVGVVAFTFAGRSAVAIMLAGLVVLLLIWVTLALLTKRLHDRNKSAWWLLLFYLAPPILHAIGHGIGSTGFILGLIGFGVSIWALVELGFLRGTAGPNSYGPDPLQVRWSA
jgi:uncharacterized membrane protein YhaH (DUF805 family)